VVLSTDDVAPDDSKEIAEDIFVINTVFICRLQGRRAGRYRQFRRQQQAQVQEVAPPQEKAGNRHSDAIHEGESGSKRHLMK